MRLQQLSRGTVMIQSDSTLMNHWLVNDVSTKTMLHFDYGTEAMKLKISIENFMTEVSF